MRLRENVPLAPLTTFKTGGPARWFVEAATEEEVGAAVAHARARKLELFVLGGGSNLVVSDGGFPGLVLKIALRGVREKNEGGRVLFDAAAGEDWDALVGRAVERDCGGIECLSGIPGTVGGTPVQNVGAYGQEVADTITRVRVFDVETGAARAISNSGSGFSYRTSIFNTGSRGRYIVLRVEYALTPGAAPHIEYADLKKFFAGRGTPTLAETRAAVRRIRAGKAMLIQDGDEDCRSAGSFFKNPVLERMRLDALTSQLEKRGLQVPQFPASDGRVKVSAAWLVEHAGFEKGWTRGAVGISRKHALAIVNRGGATAAEIVALKNEIQQRVESEFGIALVPEPVFVGF